MAVLDGAWPDPLRRQAEESVRRATAEGRVGDGRLVLFTSGSSGRPRGVVRTIASWQASVGPLTDITDISARDVVWLPGSPASTLTLYAGWHASAVGAKVRGAEGWPRTPPPSEVTALHATPRVLQAVVASAQRGELPHVRVAVVAGAALPQGLRAEVDELGWRLVEYYGAAELSFVAWRPEHAAYQRFPGVEVEVRDGEIWVRSAYVCESYLDPGDVGPLRRDGGWATVADLGRLDEDGLHVLGRGDAAVTTGGRTVVAEEVEQVVRDAPSLAGQVRDVVVTGLPHPLLGELLVAVVAVGSEGSLTRDQLDGSCAGLPAWARPRRWWLVGDLPRAASGKPDRAAVRAGVVDGSLTSRPLR